MGGNGAKIAIHAYLVAYAYWLGLALAALVLFASGTRRKAKWVVAIRRPVEIFASTMPLFVVLFIPIALCDEAHSTRGPPTPSRLAAMTHEEQHLIHHREGWINPKMFPAARGHLSRHLVHRVATRSPALRSSKIAPAIRS